MKKIKKDNSGFTLVELLIAMVIIAIVLTPLYSNFRQSTYLNGKAKKAMNATNMASNLMEGLSAYTPEEIILGFYTSDSVSGNIPGRHNTLNIMPNEVVVAEYGDLTVGPSGGYNKGFVTSDLLSGGGGSYDYSSANYAQALGTAVPLPSMDYLKIKESPSGKYYFYAEGVEQARGVYDIVLELDTTYETGFSGDENGDGAIGSGETYGINDYESTQITNINPLFDGVYTENVSQRKNAAAALLAKKTNPGLSLEESDLYPGMQRTLTVNVNKDVTTGYVTVTVDEEYAITGNFTTPGGTYVNLGSDFAGQDMRYSTTTKQIFDGSVYSQDPRNIYIYYSGNYYSSTTKYLDNFVINNSDNIPIDIFLIRTKTSETTGPLEDTYASTLTVNEPEVSGTYMTEIYSNLMDNILKTDAENSATAYRGNHARCRTNIDGWSISSVSDSRYKDVVHDTGGVKKEVLDRMYSVTMYVYDSGAAGAGFPDAMLLTTFTGSSLQ